MGYNFLFSYQCWQQVQAVAWNHHEPQVLSGYFDRSVVMVMKSLLCLLSIDLDCHYISAQGFSFLDHCHMIVSFRCFGEVQSWCYYPYSLLKDGRAPSDPGFKWSVTADWHGIRTISIYLWCVLHPSFYDCPYDFEFLSFLLHKENRGNIVSILFT